MHSYRVHLHTQTGGVTTSHAVNTAATVQIQKSTFVPVVIVVIVVALVLFTVSIVAIATTIHYRKRLKDLQQQNAATQVDQCWFLLCPCVCVCVCVSIVLFFAHCVMCVQSVYLFVPFWCLWRSKTISKLIVKHVVWRSSWQAWHYRLMIFTKKFFTPLMITH